MKKRLIAYHLPQFHEIKENNISVIALSLIIYWFGKFFKFFISCKNQLYIIHDNDRYIVLLLS
jgi:hypothetical protein